MKRPTFYDPNKVGLSYTPDLEKAFRAGLNSGITPADKHSKKHNVLAIDPVDAFLNYQSGVGNLIKLGMVPDDLDKRAYDAIEQILDLYQRPGELAITGSIKDMVNGCEYLYEDTETIDSIMISIEQHLFWQISVPWWWEGRDGNPPAPKTRITDEEVKAGIWRPRFEAQWSKNYVEWQGSIIVWDLHGPMASKSAALNPAFHEAVAYVCGARQIEPLIIKKGSIALTDHYGLFRPNILVEGHPQGKVNLKLMRQVMSYSYTAILGEAEEVCVNAAMIQLRDFCRFMMRDKHLSRLHYLEDCISRVFPNEAEHEKLMNEYRGWGVQVINSTDPVIL